jgi:hypothetical protein
MPWKLIVKASTTELYNLEQDPAESNNLAAARPELVQRLLARLHDLTPLTGE